MTERISQKITSNFSWQMLDRLLRGGGTVFINIYVGRMLGAERFGMINYCLAILSFFQVISAFGLDSIIVKKLSQRKEAEEPYNIILNSLLLKFLMSLVAALFAISYSYLFESPEIFSGIAILSLSLALSFLDVFRFYFESNYQLKYFVISELISFTIFSLLKILNLIYLRDIKLLLWTISLELMFAKIILALFFLRTSEIKLKFKIFQNKKVLFEVLREGFPLMLASFSIILYMRIDQVMIGKMLGNESLGIYSAAVRLSEAWYFVPVAISSALFPYLVRLHHQANADFEMKFQILYDFMSLLSAGFFLIVIISPTFWVRLLFGESFSSAAPILAIHAGTSFFVALGVSSNSWLNIKGYSKMILMRTVVGVCINLILNFFLIEKWGGAGCAFATLISQCLSVFSVLLIKEYRNCGVQMIKSLNLFGGSTRLLKFYITTKRS